MQSNEISFGLFMAIVLPGFIVVLGVAHQSLLVQHWIGSTVEAAPSVGGFLFLTVASVFAGLTASTIRWLIIDSIHAWAGLRQPDWDFSNLAGSLEGFNILINIHYRFYQFYTNSIIAVVVFVAFRWANAGFSIMELFLALALTGLFFTGSRDTLAKYFKRVDALLANS